MTRRVQLREANDIYHREPGYTPGMAKHLVDIDEEALDAARAELGTGSMKDTINEALRKAGARRSAKVDNALDRLARRPASPRDDAWR